MQTKLMTETCFIFWKLNLRIRKKVETSIFKNKPKWKSDTQNRILIKIYIQTCGTHYITMILIKFTTSLSYMKKINNEN